MSLHLTIGTSTSTVFWLGSRIAVTVCQWFELIFWLPDYEIASFLAMDKIMRNCFPAKKLHAFRRKHEKVGGFLKKMVIMRGRHRNRPKTHPDTLWKFTKSVGPKNSTMKCLRDMNFSGAFYIKKRCHMISSWVDVFLSPQSCKCFKVLFKGKRQEDLTLKTLWELVRHMIKISGCFTTNVAPTKATRLVLSDWHLGNGNTIFPMSFQRHQNDSSLDQIIISCFFQLFNE